MEKEGWTSFAGWGPLSSWFLPLWTAGASGPSLSLPPLLRVSCLLRSNAGSAASVRPSRGLCGTSYITPSSQRVRGLTDTQSLRGLPSCLLWVLVPVAAQGIPSRLARWECRQEPAKAMAGACGASGVGDPAWRKAAWCLSQSQTAISLCL